MAFLKAAGPDFPWPVAALDREAQVLGALGHLIPAVPMIGSGQSGDGGQVLALEWLPGHLPGFPWTEDEIALVRDACEQIADVPASALAGLTPGRLADDLLEDHALSAALATGFPLPRRSDLLPIWLPARIDEVLSLAADHQILLVGDHLNHFDLRPDNLQL